MSIVGPSNDLYYFGPSQYSIKKIRLKSNEIDSYSVYFRRWDFDIQHENQSERFRIGNVVYLSDAYKQGMRPGDEILSINDQQITGQTRIGEINHLLELNDQLEIKLRTFRLSNIDGTFYDWFNPNTNRSTSPPPSSYLSIDAQLPYQELFKRIEVKAGQSLGLVIRGGLEYGLGIFISSVDRSSLSEKSDLRIGDQLLSVNNLDFRHRTHQEAVKILRNSSILSFHLRRLNKLPRKKNFDDDTNRPIRFNSLSNNSNHRNEIEKELDRLLNDYHRRRISIDYLIQSISSFFSNDQSTKRNCLFQSIRNSIRLNDLDHFDLSILKLDFKELQNSHQQLLKLNSNEMICKKGLSKSIGNLNSISNEKKIDIDRINSIDDQIQQTIHSTIFNEEDDQTQRENSSLTKNFLKDYPFVYPITIHKVNEKLGIAIEGGYQDRIPMPRIVYIQPDGSAYLSSGLSVGDVLIQLDGQTFEGLNHRQSAILIASSFKDKNKTKMNFLIARSDSI